MITIKSYLAVCAYLILLFTPAAALAGNTHLTKTPHRPGQTVPTATVSLLTTTSPTAEAGVDVMLLMDSSGSMKRTDPRNYRRDAAKLFISLLGKEDRIGVMSFGDDATLLLPLTQNTEAGRKDLFGAVTKITSKEFSTNITAAVQKGLDELKTSRKQQRMLIMMSDGKLALGTKERDDAALAALNMLLPELAKANIKLYAVAFTGESDRVLLEKMAQDTGGFFRFAREDKDMHVMFASIFEKIKSPDTIPFEGESFTIDHEISEATVLVTKKSGTRLSLMDPSNKKNTAVRHTANIVWFESSVFDMITIQEPLAGTWSVKLSMNEGNKVYILTNLSLKTSFDKSFANRGAGIVIDAWLDKQGGTVTEKDLLESTTFSAEITGPDNKTVKYDLLSSASSTVIMPVVGKYSATIPVDAGGEYTVKLQAQGKTFKRVKLVPFTAVDPPAAPPVERKQAPLPALVQTTHAEAEIHWMTVLLRLGLVNLVVVILAAGGSILRKKTFRKREQQ